MKTINLYFDFKFTSVSPDAQPVSLGIVSDPFTRSIAKGEDLPFGVATGNETANVIEDAKSFYAEFTDFNLDRCDNWVRDNVVSKLVYGRKETISGFHIDNMDICKDTERVKEYLKAWLAQFSDYQIQFVCDCGTFDWYWMLQLLAEWEEVRTNEFYIREKDSKVCDVYRKAGLPKLPDNISPVPFDLNDLISIKTGITPKEAFDLKREELAYFKIDVFGEPECFGRKISGSMEIERIKPDKHNALWDAKVIKEVYNKLK